MATLWLAAGLFSIGAFGVLIKRNAIALLMCVELMLNAANLAFIVFAARGADMGLLDPMHGTLIVLFIIAAAAGEAAVGLAIFLKIFYDKSNVDVDGMEALRG